MVAKWAKLSKGLGGALAIEARGWARIIKIKTWNKENLEGMQQEAALRNEILELTKTSSVKEVYEQAEGKENQVVADFNGGLISFREASKRISDIEVNGYPALGRDLAERGRDQFNEIARILSRRAKSKGYANRAQYSLAAQAEDYSKGYRKLEEVRNFLTQILESTDQPFKEFLDARFASFGITPQERDPSQIKLVMLPASNLVRPYFKKENFRKMVTKILLQNGFTQEELDLAPSDDFPRQEKMNSAYMMALRQKLPATLVIDAVTLKSKADGWQNPLTQLVQNFADDGIDGFITFLHEMHHALDYMTRKNLWNEDSAYAYTEVPSTLGEELVKDPEILVSLGVPRDIAQQYSEMVKINSLFDIRFMAFRGLFDIDIWNYDYETGSETYVDRSLRLYADLHQRTYFMNGSRRPDLNYGTASFTSDHFSSGDVTYAAYTFSAIGARQMAQYILDVLEAKTGRRTFFNQPELSKILRRFYETSFKSKFPRALEKFTKVPFTSEAATAQMAGSVESWTRGQSQTEMCIGLENHVSE